MQRADQIIARVAQEEGVSLLLVLGPTRCSPRIAKARQKAMRAVHEEFPTMSWTELGRIFGRDRTTVRHACTKAADVRPAPTV